MRGRGFEFRTQDGLIFQICLLKNVSMVERQKNKG